jgi:hypothetical protein
LPWAYLLCTNTVTESGLLTTPSGVEALYTVPAARYVDPALRFQSGARIDDWA